MGLDVVHHAGIKDQAADLLLRLRTTAEDHTSIDNKIMVMSVNPPPKAEGKERTNHVIDDCDYTGANETSPGLHVVCPNTMKSWYYSTPVSWGSGWPDQGRLQPNRQRAGTVTKPGLHYLYDRHCIHFCTASLEGAERNMISNSLPPSLLYFVHYPKLAEYYGKCRMYDTTRR